MRPKIRCDGKSWKILQNFLQLDPHTVPKSHFARNLRWATMVSRDKEEFWTVCRGMWWNMHKIKEMQQDKPWLANLDRAMILVYRGGDATGPVCIETREGQLWSLIHSIPMMSGLGSNWLLQNPELRGSTAACKNDVASLTVWRQFCCKT